MTNNDILRRLRYTFNFSDSIVLELFALGGESVTQAELSAWFKSEEDEQYRPMDDYQLALFLNGLIAYKRGSKEGELLLAERYLSNNMVLRKLKIALTLKDTDIIEIFLLAKKNISKHELSAFFRHPDQAQYRLCNDQYLRNFLSGLQLRYNARKNP
ncbi:MAG: DUF1456 family protein [Bacteroidia bacterium]|jgi:uncharacterized protein YehS (DUF1456 family)